MALLQSHASVPVNGVLTPPRTGKPTQSLKSCTGSTVTAPTIQRSSRRAQRTLLKAQTQDKPSLDSSGTIQNLSTNYCDDFQCTSSPAVEQTVRSFAADILACRRLNMAWCQPDYKYTDGIRSFEGREKLTRTNQPWYNQKITKPKTTISKMQMLDKGTAQIDWRVVGSLGPIPVDINIVSVFDMNLLTGRITNHRDTVDTSPCSPPAALAVNASRLSWSVQQAAQDSRETLQQKIDEKFPKMDQNSGAAYQDPTDPTKFFQTPQQDKNFDEGVTLATIAAVIWLVFKTYAELEKLP
ncbi:hypothetical protein DUNSADRAFT_5449 [Dunaliella salina]|uniref:Uncharacterized protein n=1 Tax=Dunaliella salina TaxID=3046 RepID=A0ABQ7GQ75_DUNSA|nr:hypothetical protein DUNSADRAFT_5449 [Dunaliella salina]|eukprot:KAF5836759.1 hypothetical protein DUNSADRAFT_5449 [Dunaliella salina]